MMTSSAGMTQPTRDTDITQAIRVGKKRMGPPFNKVIAFMNLGLLEKQEYQGSEKKGDADERY